MNANTNLTVVGIDTAKKIFQVTRNLRYFILALHTKTIITLPPVFVGYVNNM